MGREWRRNVQFFSLCSPADNLSQRQHGWRTAKRPGVDYFIAYLSQFYEIVIFTTQPYYVRPSLVGECTLLILIKTLR